MHGQLYHCRHNARDRSVKVGHEMKVNVHFAYATDISLTAKLGELVHSLYRVNY